MNPKNVNITMSLPADNERNRSSGSFLALTVLILTVVTAALAAQDADEN